VLEPRIFGPPADGDLDDGLAHVDEARVLKPLLELRPDPQLPLYLVRRAHHLVGPRSPGKVGRHAAVVAKGVNDDLLALKPAAGPQVREGGPEDLRAHVLPAAEGQARVDVVEVGGEVPVFCPVGMLGRGGVDWMGKEEGVRVLHKEADVGGYHGGLDWREVGADDMGRGILVAHLDGPETGAGADVENLGGRVFRSEGGEVELTVHHFFDELVLFVQAVELGGVVGVDVGCGVHAQYGGTRGAGLGPGHTAGAEGVVCPTKLLLEDGDALCEGAGVAGVCQSTFALEDEVTTI